jgi:hypothetical protein
MKTKSIQVDIVVGIAALVLAVIYLSSINAFASAPTSTSVFASNSSSKTEPAANAPYAPDCGPDWTVVTSPNQGTAENQLFGVTVVSSSDVWAVGHYYNGSVSRTLIEHWDGTSWTIATSPNASTFSNQLMGVVALANNNVWAVGSYNNGTVNQTLIVHYNGTSWSLATSANIGAGGDGLYAVSAVSANNIWAVGLYNNASDTERTLTEHYDGTSWNVVASPNVGPADNYFNGVDAISASDVWAVGTSYDGTVYSTLIEHYNGTSWSVVPSLNPSPTYSYVTSVSAVSSNDVWAAGGYYVDNRYQTLIEHWDGTAWSISPSYNIGASWSGLEGVTAISSSNVWAVGLYRAGTINQTLVEHWNGSSWIVVDSPNMGTHANNLYSVDAISPNDIWAVGSHNNNSDIARNLIERYNPCAPNACTLQFEDVPNPSTFYAYVQCLACKGIISGYACGSPGEACNPAHDPYFRPNANVTRGQIAKIIALSAGLNTPVTTQTFEDVAPGTTFYTSTEQLYALGVMNGYACGNPEPCNPPNNRPYFRPNSNATRGQLAKIDANAAGYNENPGVVPAFNDVTVANPFYAYIQRLSMHGVINGYTCGGPGEPCPGVYYRPNANITRGQVSKVASQTFFPNACAPANR